MNALIQWNPFRKSDGGEEWRPLSRWHPITEMERLLGNWPMTPELKEPMTTAEWSPLVDITEDDNEYLVKAELPEVKREDLKVKVEDGTLSITGERKSEKAEKGRKCHRVERFYGSFERCFTLPDDADATRVTSDFKDGILRVHLAKNLNAKPQVIEVQIQ